MSSSAQSQVKISETREKAKAYLQKYDGPKIQKIFTFGSPVIRQILKREGPLFARNALFVSFFSRMLFDAAIVDPLEEALFDKFKNMQRRFGNKIVQAQELFKANGFTDQDVSEGNIEESMPVSITSPLFGQMLTSLVVADKLMTQYDSLWLNGLLKGSEYNKVRYEIKKELRGSVAFLRLTWIGLQKRIQQDRQGTLETITMEAPAAENAGQDKENPVSATDSGGSATKQSGQTKLPKASKKSGEPVAVGA